MDTEPTPILEDRKVVFDTPSVQINIRSEKKSRQNTTLAHTNQINCSRSVRKMESVELYDYSHDFGMLTILIPSGLASRTMIFVALHVLILYLVLHSRISNYDFHNSQIISYYQTKFAAYK